MADHGPLPPIDYTSRDFASLVQDMMDAIPERMPEWTSRSRNDFGIALLELFGYVGDTLAYYGDRIANEAYLATAVQRGSVLNIARMLDYHPMQPLAARTDVQFTATAGSDVSSLPDLFIPIRTQVTTRGTDSSLPIIFETVEDITVAPGESVVVGAVHGESVIDEHVGTSDGHIDQSFTLFHAPVIDGSIVLEVNESGASSGWQTWTMVTHLVDTNANDASYALWTDEDGIIHVQLGDDVNGRVPAKGSAIRAHYRVGGGRIGNIGANTIHSTVETISGLAGVTNTTPGAGGVDAETTRAIRRALPKSLSAVRRAVSIQDYETLAMKVPGVAKSKATAEIFTSVVVYIAQAGGHEPSTKLLQDVRDYFNTRKMINTTVTVMGPVFVPVNITLVLHVEDQYVQEVIRDQTVDALRGYLAFEEMDFGQSVRFTKIYRAINDVEGVSSAHIEYLFRDDESQGAPSDGVLRFGINEIPQAGNIVVQQVTGGIE